MYIVVVGGGKVGYFLSKELLEAGHELVILEKNGSRARQIADELGSIVLNRDGCEGKHLAEAGANRATIVAAVTGDEEDNLVVCQMAKHHFDVPRTIARVNNPKNEQLFRHLGVDEIISPTRMASAQSSRTFPFMSCCTWQTSRVGRSSYLRPRSRTTPRRSAGARRTFRYQMAALCSCSPRQQRAGHTRRYGFPVGRQGAGRGTRRV